MSVYSHSERTTHTLNGSRSMSGSAGTIDPQALNSGGVGDDGSNSLSGDQRGTKRSRSPDDYGQYLQATDTTEDAKRRKRGRQSKTPHRSTDLGRITVDGLELGQEAIAVQPVAATPTQASPSTKSTPKSTLKALPTVRDHTSDQLGPDGVEFLTREHDDAGEQKVDDMGYLQGGRQYRIKTFKLPGRGEKLFMLATECARTLQYRDSYLLFNKNRSLYKIIASAAEKEELVKHEILPYSYRSRQIALVTARSMFRQFGSRVIRDGRRVRDDYWEAKAVKQGFTEADPAGEKRPGAARAREVAAAEARHNQQLQVYGDIVYSNGPAHGVMHSPPTHSSLISAMIQYPILESYDAKYRDVTRPRQEMTGPAYSDLTRSTNDAEMASQSAHAAEYSRTVNIQGRFRKGIVNDYWNRPHDPPVLTPQQENAEPVVDQTLSSPQFDENDQVQNGNVLPQSSTSSAMNPPSFPHPQNPLQSPSRQSSMSYSREFTPGHLNLPRTSSNLSISQSASQQSPMPFGNFSPVHAHSQPLQQQNWGQPPPQPQQSPVLNNRMFNMSQSSPHLQQGSVPSPMPGGHSAHSQSPHPQQHPMQPPQMYPQGNMMSSGQALYGPGAGLRAMNAAGYSGMNMPQPNMYQMGGQAQFMQQSNQPNQQFMGQQWQNFQ